MILEGIGSVISQIPIEIWVSVLIFVLVSYVYAAILIMYMVVMSETKSYLGFLSAPIITFAGAVCAIIISGIESLGHKILPGLITPPDIFILSLLIGLTVFIAVTAWNKFYWGAAFPWYYQKNHRTWSKK